MRHNEQVCKKLKAKHGLYFAKGKEQVKRHRMKEPDKSKYEIYTAVKNEIGKSRNWQQLQERLAEKGISSREETLERLGAIEQTLPKLHSGPAVPEKELQAIQSQLADIRNAKQEQQQSIGEVRRFVTATCRCLKKNAGCIGFLP